MKMFKNENDRNIFLKMVAVPFSLFIVAMFISLLFTNPMLSVLLSLGITLLINQMLQGYFISKFETAQKELLGVVVETQTLAKMLNTIQEIDSEDLKAIAKRRYEEFVERFNKELLGFSQGVCKFGFEDTSRFLHTGLKHTKNDGTILATFNGFSGEWNVKRYRKMYYKKYLDEQRELITNKNVTIERIFFLSNREMLKDVKVLELLNADYETKIKVFCIFKDEIQMGLESANWLSEDYLIQDNEKLVRFHPPREDYRTAYEKDGYEEIFIKSKHIQEMVKRFVFLRDNYAEEYKPEPSLTETIPSA
jgi:hypothetical protein